MRAFITPSRLFPGSSAVEQPAVNRLVAGSNPARGATFSQTGAESVRRRSRRADTGTVAVGAHALNRRPIRKQNESESSQPGSQRQKPGRTHWPAMSIAVYPICRRDAASAGANRRPARNIRAVPGRSLLWCTTRRPVRTVLLSPPASFEQPKMAAPLGGRKVGVMHDRQTTRNARLKFRARAAEKESVCSRVRRARWLTTSR